MAALRPAFDVSPPAGGWFVWPRLPGGVTASKLLPVAEQHGVSFVPGPSFYPDGTSGDQYVRLAFSFLQPPHLTEAATRLTQAIASRELDMNL